jgi:hypothetical protein
MMVALSQIILGLLPLLFGRRLFWLFVGIVGFLAGVALSGMWLQGQNEWLQLLVAIVLGVICGWLAIVIQRPMAMVAGFLALGSVGLLLANGFGETGGVALLFALLLGIAGAVLVAMTFDWALIILSALNGAGSISAGVIMLVPALPDWVALILTVVLAAMGIAYQSRDLERKQRAA